MAEVSNKHNKALSHYENDHLLGHYKVSRGPGAVNYLTFEDFFLYTQVAKELALKISSLAYPRPEELADKLPSLKKLKKYKDIIPRIEAYLKTNFGFVKQNDSDNLAELISNHL